MPPQTLRIATYNVRKAMGTDRRRDPERILRIIRALRADVVMLQEADYRLSPRPAALPIDRVQSLSGLVPIELGEGPPSLGTHGNAILVNPGWQVEAAHSIDLPGLEPRGAIVAKLRIPDGRPVCAIGAHLGLLRFARKHQIRALVDWHSASEMATFPTILAGDFNERSKTKGLDELQARFNLLPPRNSFHARLPRWPLDRIATSQHFSSALSEIVLTEETRLASDHLPLCADLEWAESVAI